MEFPRDPEPPLEVTELPNQPGRFFDAGDFDTCSDVGAVNDMGPNEADAEVEHTDPPEGEHAWGAASQSSEPHAEATDDIPPAAAPPDIPPPIPPGTREALGEQPEPLPKFDPTPFETAHRPPNDTERDYDSFFAAVEQHVQVDQLIDTYREYALTEPDPDTGEMVTFVSLEREVADGNLAATIRQYVLDPNDETEESLNEIELRHHTTDGSFIAHNYMPQPDGTLIRETTDLNAMLDSSTPQAEDINPLDVKAISHANSLANAEWRETQAAMGLNRHTVGTEEVEYVKGLLEGMQPSTASGVDLYVLASRATLLPPALSGEYVSPDLADNFRQFVEQAELSGQSTATDVNTAHSTEFHVQIGTERLEDSIVPTVHVSLAGPTNAIWSPVSSYIHEQHPGSMLSVVISHAVIEEKLLTRVLTDILPPLRANQDPGEVSPLYSQDTGWHPAPNDTLRNIKLAMRNPTAYRPQLGEES